MPFCDIFYFEISNDMLKGMSFFLSEDEKKRFDRYKIRNAAVNFAVCRGCLRKILSGYIGVKPEDILFSYTDSGKPFVNGIEFNISHSGNSCVIAVSDIPVGIDIEKILQKSFFNISKRYFSSFEHDIISNAENQSFFFYRSWCMRESFAKLLGKKLCEIMAEKYEFNPEILKLNNSDEFFFSSIPFDDLCCVVCQKEYIPPVLYFPNL